MLFVLVQLTNNNHNSDPERGHGRQDTVHIFFDIGFTLMGGPSQSPPKKIRKILGLPKVTEKRLKQIIFSRDFKDVYALINYLSRELRICINTKQQHKIEKYWAEQARDAYVLPGATNMVKAVQSQHNTHIISNIWRPFYHTYRDKMGVVATKMVTETLSFKEQISKPDILLYERAMYKAKAKPEYCVMVGDDIEKDIIPAMQKGMRAVWYTSRINDPIAARQELNKLFECFAPGYLEDNFRMTIYMADIPVKISELI